MEPNLPPDPPRIESDVPLPPRENEHFATVDGDREITKKGFNLNAFEAHLRKHHFLAKKWRKQWCDLECAARFFEKRSTEEKRKLTRRRFHRAASEFIARGIFLLKKYGDHGDLQAVKIFNSKLDEDYSWARTQFEAALEKGEETEEKLQRMAKIIGYPLGPKVN